LAGAPEAEAGAPFGAAADAAGGRVDGEVLAERARPGEVGRRFLAA